MLSFVLFVQLFPYEILLTSLDRFHFIRKKKCRIHTGRNLVADDLQICRYCLESDSDCFVVKMAHLKKKFC